MSDGYQVVGQNNNALFTLKAHRGDGMALLAMNWKVGMPPDDFVGFAIQYKEPGGNKFYSLKNRISFPTSGGSANPNALSTLLSPIQKFRWVHFPRNAHYLGAFTYRVTPVFMNSVNELSYGEAQEAAIELRRDTYPGLLNITFTRGFISSQAFVDNYESEGDISTLLPANADDGLSFIPIHPKSEKAMEWMGFEAWKVILDVLDRAIIDLQAQVRVVAYDLNQPEIVQRLEQLGGRLRIIIDDSGSHGEANSSETQAEARLKLSTGVGNVKRQHMAKLQHNKTILVDSPNGKTVVCGSTNFSWRGFFVQSNNALVLHGDQAAGIFMTAFDNYWSKKADKFRTSASAQWNDLGLPGIDAQAAFSPHGSQNALLATIAQDIQTQTTSSLMFSLAFLYQTPGPILNAIQGVMANQQIFVYGISDRKVGGLEVIKPDGNVLTVYPAALKKNVPAPFSEEPVGGSGNRMHHKFVVIDFNKPTARVYLGSYNFSGFADTKNGENLLLIRDRRVAVSYAIEALRMIDAYHFRVKQGTAKKPLKKLELALPPRQPGDQAWWAEYYTVQRKIMDRELFA